MPTCLATAALPMQSGAVRAKKSAVLHGPTCWPGWNWHAALPRWLRWMHRHAVAMKPWLRMRQRPSGAQQPADIALLPKAQQAVAAQQPADAAMALTAIEDPLSRLVAAGALAVRGPLPMAVVQQAVDTASAQGWRRALLAWLINQQRLAQEQGDTVLAAQLQRRLDVLQTTQK